MSDFSLRDELQKVENLSYDDFVDSQFTKKAYEKAEEILNLLIPEIKYYENEYQEKINSLTFVFVYVMNKISLWVFPKQLGKKFFCFDDFESFNASKLIDAVKDILAKDYEVKPHNFKWVEHAEVASAFSIKL